MFDSDTDSDSTEPLQNKSQLFNKIRKNKKKTAQPSSSSSQVQKSLCVFIFVAPFQFQLTQLPLTCCVFQSDVDEIQNYRSWKKKVIDSRADGRREIIKNKTLTLRMESAPRRTTRWCLPWRLIHQVVSRRCPVIRHQLEIYPPKTFWIERRKLFLVSLSQRVVSFAFHQNV